MSGGEEQPECPLCMEPLEIDDVSFYPCTCGYQICRFCWHRIRVDENGLCPACRKAYPEDPAEFKPLTDDEIHRIKKDRRQKESQRKQKSAESRKHLTNIRVVQKNLVFVVGLSPRLCDPETLRRHEYFGKFGKIHKVVINQSTSYVGAQGPSASAYVTYFRPEDALAAIRTVNNVQVDGRTLKASLGTTKYCSHFLKGTQCMKQDCMYLHDYGDESASFSKEEIQQGKHLAYEQRLCDQFGGGPASEQLNNKPPSSVNKQKELSPPSSGELSPVGPPAPSSSPLMVVANDSALLAPSQPVPVGSNGTVSLGQLSAYLDSTSVGSNTVPASQQAMQTSYVLPSADNLSLFSNSGFPNRLAKLPIQQPTETAAPKVADIPDTISSSADNNGTDWQPAYDYTSNSNNTGGSESLSQDDDLGFDPWAVSSRALADLIEKDKICSSLPPPPPNIMPPLPIGMPPAMAMNAMHPFPSRLKVLPPGFTPNGFAPNMPNMRHPMFAPHMAALHQQQQRSRLMGMMQSVQQQQQQPETSPQAGSSPVSCGAIPRMPLQPTAQSPASHNLFPNQVDAGSRLQEPVFGSHPEPVFFPRSAPPQQPDVFMWRDWQEGLKAILPNVNITFGNMPGHNSLGTGVPQPGGNVHSNGFLPSQGPLVHRSLQPGEKNWSSNSVPDLSWDPAIINSGDVTTADNINDETPPHWMASLHHLTEDSLMVPGAQNHIDKPLFAQSPGSPSMSWMPNSRLLPPGFGLNLTARPNGNNADYTEHQLPAL